MSLPTVALGGCNSPLSRVAPLFGATLAHSLVKYMRKVKAAVLPRIRFGHKAVHFEDGRSIVGSYQFGLAQQISDPHNKVLLLNDILDGFRDFDEAVAEFSRRAEVSIETSRSLIQQLTRLGHIEDASAPTSLLPDEQDRYSRSADYFAWITRENELSHWTSQERLKHACVCVLGVGGLGSVIATQLVASGVGSVTIVDSDVVEQSNLNRQTLYRTSDIGTPKVEAAAVHLLELNPLVQVTAVNQRIESKESIVRLFEQHNLLFRSADRPDDLPYWTSDAALITEKPWVDASYNGPMVSCCIFVPGQTGCYRCLRESGRKQVESEGRLAVYSDAVPLINAALGPIVGISGSLAAYEGIRFLTNKQPQSVGRYIHQNMYRYSNSYAVPVPSDCPHNVKP